MEAFKKLQQARKLIKENDLKKLGRNDFSKYDYYTPEQVNKLVSDVAQKLNLFNKFDLIRTELGLVAVLTVMDLETGKYLEFKTATEIPEIKATNVAQQLGGTMTYSNRYLLMFAYEIIDNNLDFDATGKDNSSKPKPSKKNYSDTDDQRPWLSELQLKKTVERIRSGEPGEQFTTMDEFVDHVKETFRMKKTYLEEIEAEMNDEFNKAVQ